jgi:sugar-specific transcriptional regulator TrmB
MRRTILLLVMVAASILMAGCSEPQAQGNEAEQQNPKKQQAASKQEKTVVVVNEGMSKKEEKKLQQRLDELEKKVNDKGKEAAENKEASESEQDGESTEEQALEAAQDYYAAAASGNYNYTYDALSSASQSQFTEDEWVAANTALGSDAGTYHIDATNVVDDSTVVVYLTITLADGSTSERVTKFVLADGSWKHDLTQEENELFAGAIASASATASAPATSSDTASSTDKTFGDGTYQVGTDIQPGTYRTREGSPGCYYERLSGFSGEMNEILANGVTDAPAIVTIKPTDAGFQSQGCGTWTKDLSAITESETSFGEGAYIVGTDIEPGTYRSSGSSGCYYERLSDFTGDMNSIIANGVTDAPAVVTIAPTDAGFQSSDCGTWSKLE